MTCAFRVLKRDQESAGRRRVVLVIHTAPGVHVDRAVGRHRKLAGVADLVSKDRCTEAVGQTQTGIALRAFPLSVECRNCADQERRNRNDAQASGYPIALPNAHIQNSLLISTADRAFRDDLIPNEMKSPGRGHLAMASKLLC
jgi:hypothetical protein